MLVRSLLLHSAVVVVAADHNFHATASSSQPVFRVFVDPLRGVDTPAASGIAGSEAAPLRTLGAARDRLRRASSMAQPKEVVLHAGNYEALALGPADSGTAEHPIKWTGMPGAVISAGRRLSGQWSAPAAAGQPWMLRVEGLGAGATFNQLFVDGSRAIRARQPDAGGYFRMEAQLDGAYSEAGFVYEGSDLDELAGALHANATAAEAVIFTSWQAARRTVRTVIAANRTLLLESAASIDIDPYANSGSRYYVENFAAVCHTHYFIASPVIIFSPYKSDKSLYTSGLRQRK